MKDRRKTIRWRVGFAIWYVTRYLKDEIREYVDYKIESLLLRDLFKGNVRLWYNKRRLGKAYVAYSNTLGIYGCGNALHNIISSRTIRSRIKLDKAYEKCKKLDPNIPPKSW